MAKLPKKKIKCFWVYGMWNNYGWGTMLVTRSKLDRVAFKAEDSKNIKVIDKNVYKNFKIT